MLTLSQFLFQVHKNATETASENYSPSESFLITIFISSTVVKMPPKLLLKIIHHLSSRELLP